jgi:hypothetical protein
MTSASQGYRAAAWPEVLPGRGRPSGLHPIGFWVSAQHKNRRQAHLANYTSLDSAPLLTPATRPTAYPGKEGVLMGSRPSFGRRPASQGKIVQETKPCPTGARQKAWRRRDRGAPPAFSSDASLTRFHAHGQRHTARLWHWGVLAGQILVLVRPRAADGALPRWPDTTPPSPARHGVAARWRPTFPPAQRHGSKSGSQFKPCSHACPAGAVAWYPGRTERPHGGVPAPAQRHGTKASTHNSCTGDHGSKAKRSSVPRTASACSRGGFARRLGVAAARRPSSVHPNHLHEYASPFARRRRRSGTRPAQERYPSRHGYATARRPASRQKIHGDAPPHKCQHSKNSRGRREVESRGAHGGATV